MYCFGRKLIKDGILPNIPTHPLLTDFLLLLMMAALAAFAFERARLLATLGYLLTGVIIGPHGLAWLTHAESIKTTCRFGSNPPDAYHRTRVFIRSAEGNEKNRGHRRVFSNCDFDIDRNLLRPVARLVPLSRIFCGFHYRDEFVGSRT